jgi:hypothetical protein
MTTLGKEGREREWRGQWRWRKKYISAAMISNARRKRKMAPALLRSGVMGEASSDRDCGSVVCS